MTLPVTLLVILIAGTAIFIGVLVFRPGMTTSPVGKIFAFFLLFLLPLVCLGMGTSYHIERSKETTFCLSCHEMEPMAKACWSMTPLIFLPPIFKTTAFPLK